MKRLFIAMMALAATWSVAGSLLADDQAKAAGKQRPNIVFIMADDYGIDGVGCYGSDRFKDKTPNLDALAKSGIRFERCYCTPLCGPTRCLLTTGRYGFRTGGMSNGSASRPSYQDEPAMAKVLKQAGYATGMAGKWRQMTATPGDWGFDEYVTDPTPSGYFWEKSYTKNGQRVEKDEEFYYPDVQQQFAVDFFQRHREEPFFFYYSMHLVHGPILRTPDSKADGAAGKRGGSFYDDNVAYLDKQVGQIAAELDKLGLRERTLLVFSTDNGTAGGSGTIGGQKVNGAKGSMWEGGAHVPLIASWPGTAPPGRVLKDLVDFSDLVPTFAELAGGKLPEGVTFDGRSFAPQLRGETGQPREWIFVQLGSKWYARNDGWKLNESGELFDMQNAPFVEKPVPADTQDAPAIAAKKQLQGVLAQLNPAGGKTEPPKTDAPKKNKRKKNMRKAATS